MGRELTIGDEGGGVGKSLAVLEGTIFVHVERVDGGGRREVAAVKSQGNASVGDVSFLAIRGEGETYMMLASSTGRAWVSGLTVGQSEVVSDDSDSACLEVVSVDLVAQARWRAEVLQEAVEGIREV